MPSFYLAIPDSSESPSVSPSPSPVPQKRAHLPTSESDVDKDGFTVLRLKRELKYIRAEKASYIVSINPFAA